MNMSKIYCAHTDVVATDSLIENPRNPNRHPEDQIIALANQDYENEAAEWADMIADNRIAELAVADEGELKALISELNGQIDLDLTGFSDSALEDLLTEPQEVTEEEEAEKVKMQKLCEL